MRGCSDKFSVSFKFGRAVYHSIWVLETFGLNGGNYGRSGFLLRRRMPAASLAVVRRYLSISFEKALEVPVHGVHPLEPTRRAMASFGQS